MNNNQNVGYTQRAINPDEYVDLALKSVLNYNAKVADLAVMDLDKVKDTLVFLVNQAENVCIGSGYINRKKRKLETEELCPEEKQLYEAAMVYFKSKTNIFGSNIERLATKLLEEAVDGEYDSKVSFMREKLSSLVEKKELDDRTMDIQLANYKFQLMLDAVQSSKARRGDFNV